MHSLVTVVANYALIIPITGLLMTWLLLDTKIKKKQFLIEAFVAALLIILLARFASWLFYNPRPFVVGHFKPYFSHPNNNGFPSDHTLFTSYVAFLILNYNRKLGLILLIIAMAVGLARVMAGVHHLVDIAAAFAISGVTIVIVHFYVNRNLAAK